MQIDSLYRYPIKGLSPERLDIVQVAAGEGFPLDRAFALLRTDAGFDPAEPAWLPKANFVMLMLHEQVAALKTRYMPAENRLRVCTPEGHEFDFPLDSDAGAMALGQFLLEFMPKRLSAPPRLLRAPGHQFTDKAEKFVSLINLASVRALEARWGQALDPLRFRANIYVDGAEPFVELDWVGREIRLGTVIAQVAQRNGRCAATNVNPVTGVRDRDVPGRLRAEFGHKDLGVYLKIVEGGNLRAGNVLSVKAAIGRPVPAACSDDTGADRLICSACYFLLKPGTRDLPRDYRCPDCGADREAVLPANARRPKA